jgi:peptidoglycan hydrolase-like protein with peptidoglycan-binding domain
VHVSARTDCADVALDGYDPVAAALRKPRPAPADDWTRRIVMGLPQLKAGAQGTPVRRLQALINVAGGHVSVDGDFGAGTGAELRKIQTRLKVGADGIAGPKTWAALLGVAV